MWVFLYLLIGIVLLLLMITRFKIPAFIALVIVALGLGLAQGMGVEGTLKSVETGVGSTLGYLALVLGFGAILGALLVESGAAQRISSRMITAFGKKHIVWGLVATGFIIGIPLFYTVGFVMLIPIVFTISRQLKLPLVYTGIPMIAALSVTHGFLPPHPAPTLIAVDYQADMGLTLLWGLVIAVPSIILAGPLFASTLKKIHSVPNNKLVKEMHFEESEMPPFGQSVLLALSPVTFMAIAAVVKLTVVSDHWFMDVIEFIGSPIVALLLAVLLSIYFLGIRRGKKMEDIRKISLEAVSSIAFILLIIGAGGALKQILVDSGLSTQITDFFTDKNFSPILMAWSIAAILRITLGSATVAATTAAGIVAPMMGQIDVSPELLVLATGAGSLTFSQVNDTGFWLFKEYFNLTIAQTFRTWTVMETIISICGLIGCLLLNMVI